MKSIKAIVVAFVAAVMVAIPCMAQDVQPPFTWAGKGAAWYISEQGIEDTEFRFELSVDEQGMVSGQASNEDGVSKVKHIFYSEPKQYDWPGYFSRKIVFVLLFNESGGYPMVGVYNGRLLMDKFLYGEILLTGYEAGSDTARTLGVGDAEATLIEGDELPYNLRSTLEKCFPIGVVKIEGDFKSEDTGAAAETPESQGDTIVLFNGKDLDNWHIYSQDSGADPKSVWKVKNGEILCSGKPTGFLRTKQQYGDYKLTLEWKWPEKGGNSGVLLRMGGAERVWPLCMEAQLMHKRAGDLIGMGCNFNENKAKEGGPISYTPRMNDSNEKELGGWNRYEITCKGDTIEVSVNGRLQNRATGVTLTKGYIGLQSEGVPIMFRNIKLTPLR